MKTKYEWENEFERRRKAFGCEPSITDFVMDVQDDAKRMWIPDFLIAIIFVILPTLCMIKWLLT